MPVPSFDEILEQARKYQQDEADTEASNRTNSLIAGGISDLFKKTLIDPYATKQYAGEINMGTGDLKAFQTPQYEGATVASKLFGVKPYEANENSIPLTREEAVDYRLKRALVGDKEKINKQFLLDKIKLEKSLNPKQVTATTPMSRWESALVYMEAYPGLTMDEALLKEPLTYGGAERISSMRGVSLRSLGLDYAAGKDIVGQTDPNLIEEQKRIEQQRLEELKNSGKKKTPPKQTSTEVNTNEVERVTSDGKTAIFDKVTKKFLRYK